MHELLQRLDLPNLSAQAIHFGLRLAAPLILPLVGGKFDALGVRMPFRNAKRRCGRRLARYSR